jgi:hypothetical protein
LIVLNEKLNEKIYPNGNFYLEVAIFYWLEQSQTLTDDFSKNYE